MSALRQRLKRPESYLGILALTITLIFADSRRPAAHQLSARIYVGIVHTYQHFSNKGILTPYVRCRFNPTCSHYSEEAVRKYGLRKGFLMTADRLWRCRSSVPASTSDPVP
jgi:uncharacterized protein